MRTRGKITSWNDEQGFGFITPGDGGKRVFVHIRAFSNRNRRPEINQMTSYALSTDRHGRAWPGALVAQQKLRHKSRKQAFQSVFWVTVLQNCGAFVWLFSPTGTATLRSLMASVV
jgi:cold shock CspA family protein